MENNSHQTNEGQLLPANRNSITDLAKTTVRHPKACDITWKNDIDTYYNIYAELGRGRYSVVKKCVEKVTGKESAAKLIKKRLSSLEDVEREVNILKKLKHPHLCSFIDAYDTPKNYLIVLGLLSGGRLFDYLVVMDNLTEKAAIGYIHEILEGVQYLHDLNIVHLDLKPQNFLLDGGPLQKVKIIDFGSARELTGKPTTCSICGSPEFSAPELINGEPVTCKMDMWSIGVVTYIMLSGISPFQGDTTDDMCDKIRREPVEFPDKYFSPISAHAQNFIHALLLKDAIERADCQDSLKSNWIRMMSPRPPSPVRTIKLNISRLAAFNARRRNQHDLNPLSSTRSAESDL